MRCLAQGHLNTQSRPLWFSSSFRGRSWERDAERRGAADQLPAGPRALQQDDPAGRQQEPAGHHLNPGVPLAAYQRGEWVIRLGVQLE